MLTNFNEYQQIITNVNKWQLMLKIVNKLDTMLTNLKKIFPNLKQCYQMQTNEQILTNVN